MAYQNVGGFQSAAVVGTVVLIARVTVAELLLGIVVTLVGLKVQVIPTAVVVIVHLGEMLAGNSIGVAVLWGVREAVNVVDFPATTFCVGGVTDSVK